MEDSSKTLKNLLKIEESNPVYLEDRVVWRLPNGSIHRVHGPAIEMSNGYKEWKINGVTHRLNGPAIIDEKGQKFYFINGKEISEPLFNSIYNKKAN